MLPPKGLIVAPTSPVPVTATVTYELTSRSQTVVAARAAASDSQTKLVSDRPSMEQTYNSEITRLREIVNQRASQLDPATVEVLEKNLKVIDDAIVQCKDALRSDPKSRFLIESLNDALESKVVLLRKAASLPTKA